MPTRREVAENATEHLEKAMPRRHRLGIWARLRACPTCRAYLRQSPNTIALTRRAAPRGPVSGVMKAAARAPKPD